MNKSASVDWFESANTFATGQRVTRGLGAEQILCWEGSSAGRPRPNKRYISRNRHGFYCCRDGGGTGTGAAPIVADMAKELGI